MNRCLANEDEACSDASENPLSCRYAIVRLTGNSILECAGEQGD